MPALQATNEHLLLGLQESGRSGGGGRRMHRLRATLVVAEMALAVILLTGAGLLIRSFIALTQVDPGFQPGGAITLRVTLQGAEYQTGDQIRSRVDQLITRVRELPQVTAVGVGIDPAARRAGRIERFRGRRRAAAAARRQSGDRGRQRDSRLLQGDRRAA